MGNRTIRKTIPLACLDTMVGDDSMKTDVCIRKDSEDMKRLLSYLLQGRMSAIYETLMHVC